LKNRTSWGAVSFWSLFVKEKAVQGLLHCFLASRVQ